MPVIGLAKEREEVFLPNVGQPFILPANSQALYLLQRLRDEAHRFAITYHRKLRAKSQVKSVLDDLPGVGPARKRALLRVFGSTRQMRSATVDEIAAVPGISRSLAERIHAGLNA
jgi:excinuclease ABC subunit C